MTAAATSPIATTRSLEDLRRELLQAYAGLPLAGRPYALVDLPHYLNIGDSLITLGELELLRATHPDARPIFCGGLPSDRLLERLNELAGVLLIHGGGNFGSIWPQHQAFRERAARSMPRATIVQLPQSVHFDTPVAREVSLRVLAEHGDFHVMVRDHASYEQLLPYSMASLQRLPDSAFALRLSPRGRASHDLLVLRRQDAESTHARSIDHAVEALGSASILSGDWASDVDLPVPWPAAERFMARLWSRVTRRGGHPAFQRLAWSNISRARMELGRRIVSSGRVVLTDRLHVHVLCVLLGKPHVFFDNSYGKIHGLATSCGTLGQNAVAAHDADDAAGHLRRMLADAGSEP